jgi:uncharacterized membrane protein YgaE (UPF0421/DUF939 family)
MLCSFVLICSGVYMCIRGLAATGSIGIKSAVFEGKIETGSLGLLAIFLGVVIVLVMNLRSPFRGQEIRLVVNGNEISAKGISYRKLQELVRAASGNEYREAARERNAANPDASANPKVG